MNLIDELINKIIAFDKLSVSRAISVVEDELTGREQILKRIFEHTGKAYRIGITGPPGAGKSTVTNALVKLLNDKELKIGVIAVDPTSPFTGGALLGDRIRMQEVGILKNVFIRSMATRGSLGGLSKNVTEACDILDAAGMDFIFIETVGVGQSELDIAQTADTTIVVLVPESGDSVQAMKAGLMEIANIFVLNKSDRDGAELITSTIKNITHLKPAAEDGWRVNVMNTTAKRYKGISELLAEIIRHKDHLTRTGFLEKKRKKNLEKHIFELVKNKLEVNFWNNENIKSLDLNIEKIFARLLNPYDFVEEIFNNSTYSN
jgi:LAO/AO transport system kinase